MKFFTSKRFILGMLIFLLLSPCVWIGIWWFARDVRDIYGQPRQTCVFGQENEWVRLYVGGSSHATTSDRYILAYQKAGSSEKIFFSAYSSPTIKELKCGGDQMTIVEFGPNPDTYTISLAWIKDELVNRPLKFYKMTLQTPEYKDKVSTWKGIEIR